MYMYVPSPSEYLKRDIPQIIKTRLFSLCTNYKLYSKLYIALCKLYKLHLGTVPSDS